MKLQLKNKQETQRNKLLEMQRPTSEQIEKQFSVEVDSQLNQNVCESAFKKPSSKKNKKRKRKGLHTRLLNRTTTLSETVHKTILEKATEETGVLKLAKLLLVFL